MSRSAARDRRTPVEQATDRLPIYCKVEGTSHGTIKCCTDDLLVCSATGRNIAE
jgi:hypothetical protein